MIGGIVSRKRCLTPPDWVTIKACECEIKIQSAARSRSKMQACLAQKKIQGDNRRVSILTLNIIIRSSQMTCGFPKVLIVFVSLRIFFDTKNQKLSICNQSVLFMHLHFHLNSNVYTSVNKRGYKML